MNEARMGEPLPMTAGDEIAIAVDGTEVKGKVVAIAANLLEVEITSPYGGWRTGSSIMAMALRFQSFSKSAFARTRANHLLEELYAAARTFEERRGVLEHEWRLRGMNEYFDDRADAEERRVIRRLRRWFREGHMTQREYQEARERIAEAAERRLERRQRALDRFITEMLPELAESAFREEIETRVRGVGLC